MAPLSIHIKESHIKSRNVLHTILRRPLATSCQPLVPPTTDHQLSHGPPDSKQAIITCPFANHWLPANTWLVYCHQSLTTKSPSDLIGVK